MLAMDDPEGAAAFRYVKSCDVDDRLAIKICALDGKLPR